MPHTQQPLTSISLFANRGEVICTPHTRYRRNQPREAFPSNKSRHSRRRGERREKKGRKRNKEGARGSAEKRKAAENKRKKRKKKTKKRKKKNEKTKKKKPSLSTKP